MVPTLTRPQGTGQGAVEGDLPNGVSGPWRKEPELRPTVLIVGRNSSPKAWNEDALGSSGLLAREERYTGDGAGGGNSSAASSDPTAGLGSSTALSQQAGHSAADVATSPMWMHSCSQSHQGVRETLFLLYF